MGVSNKSSPVDTPKIGENPHTGGKEEALHQHPKRHASETDERYRFLKHPYSNSTHPHS